MDSDQPSRASGEEGTGAPTPGATERTTATAPLSLAALDLADRTDDTELTVRGYNYDDETGAVELTVAVGTGEVVLSLDAPDARDLAAGIAEAARYAEEGSR